MPLQTLVDDSVFQFRAVRTRDVCVDDDPEEMVQQQFARLQFFESRLGDGARRILDWGCGSGFNCRYLQRAEEDREIVGFDVSPAAIRLARQSFPEVEFQVADACDPSLCIRPGEWDRILSCEVLEHVPDMPEFVANIRRHLSPDGAAFISTPNRLVFSLGHEPSPVNKEHIKELTREEFASLLRPHFSHVEMYGQRFKDETKLRVWEAEVRGKIRACEEGTRWVEKTSLRARLRKWRLVNWAYQVPLLRAAWQALRWRAAARLRKALRPALPPYRWTDFEFVSRDFSDSVWFCAIVRP